MKVVIALVIIGLTGVSTDMAGECDMAAFYLELGCKPESSTEEFCPDKFKCPDLHPDPTKCYYKSQAYSHKESIPQNIVSNPCSQACSCSVFNEEPQFLCAAVDCYETFDSDMSQQCINTYELDSCCSTGTVCGKDAVAKLQSCIVDGRTYLEGQMFEPLNTQKSCICTAEWDGSVENRSYCRNVDCGIELHYQNSLLENCAPVFANSMRTCPIGFECPTVNSKIIRGLNIKQLTTQCVFSNMTLNIGDEVAVEDNCTKCTCKIPPFVSCIRSTCN
ncbi:unnamed protein product [Arctia plantaginis]|uniref:VWFD domain-containing protein n=1 Tax=Arctia plantaginis TaxID=874455 RepID=A0A8S0ZUV7_ARCPL|nr:unnamed protein product [Arctia plantaginis]